MVRRRAASGEETTLIVDAAPEFRLQANAAGARRLDALLLTHDHADQCHGLDDIRAFAISQRRRIPCWMDASAAQTLGDRFGYIFRGQGLYPAIAELNLVPPAEWRIEGPSGPIPVIAFEQDHGDVKSLGYRFGPIAYSSDLVDLPAASFEALKGVEVWIVDALRDTPHPTHAHVDKALGWIDRVKPARAILTNMHFDLDYAALAARLPKGVEPAFDGLTFEVDAGEQ